MRILLIGCFHGKFPSKLKNIASKCDAIISTGDFGGSDAYRRLIFKHMKTGLTIDESQAKKFKKIAYKNGINVIKELENLKAPVYTIYGNWDFTDRSELKLETYNSFIKRRKKLFFWGHSIRNFRGLKLYTHGGLMYPSIFKEKNSIFSDSKKKIYAKLHKKQVKELFKRKSKNIDLFIAHCPPHNYFDKVNFKNSPQNGNHVGFKGYTDYIKKYQPKIFICGHMHEHQGMKKLGKTTIISHGAAQDGNAAILELSNDYKKFRVEFIK